MKRFLAAFAAASIVALSLALIIRADVPKPPEIPDFAKKVPEFKSGDPVFAFNGKDLDGWYTFLRNNKYNDPDQVFSVKHGMLVISGGEFGGITTKQAFKNYHLVTEWKWGDRVFELIDPANDSISRKKGCARDAGILVHAVGADGGAYLNWMESIELQIIEGGIGDFLLVPGKGVPSLTVEVWTDEASKNKQRYFQPGRPVLNKKGGRVNWWGRDPAWTDTLGIRDRFKVEKPHGEWNRLEAICDGDSITTIFNGYVVNAGTKASHTEGKIQLQSEGAEIIYRKVEVRPLVK